MGEHHGEKKDLMIIKRKDCVKEEEMRDILSIDPHKKRTVTGRRRGQEEIFN